MENPFFLSSRLTLFFVFLFAVSNSAIGGTLLTYSTLQKSSTEKTLGYLRSLQQTLAHSKDKQLDKVIARKVPASPCSQRNMWTCFPGVYGLNRCVASRDNARKTCGRAISNKELLTYMNNPEFYRSGWNAFLAGISGECKKKYTETCKILLKIKGDFLRGRTHL